MLINKLLIEEGFIIPRTIDSKEIKYFMDLGYTPIVGYFSYVKDVPHYGYVMLVYTYNRWPLSNHIQPLPVFYIKKFFRYLEDFLQMESYIDGKVNFRTIVERTLSCPMFISRDLL